MTDTILSQNLNSTEFNWQGYNFRQVFTPNVLSQGIYNNLAITIQTANGTLGMIDSLWIGTSRQDQGDDLNFNDDQLQLTFSGQTSFFVSGQTTIVSDPIDLQINTENKIVLAGHFSGQAVHLPAANNFPGVNFYYKSGTDESGQSYVYNYVPYYAVDSKTWGEIDNLNILNDVVLSPDNNDITGGLLQETTANGFHQGIYTTNVVPGNATYTVSVYARPDYPKTNYVNNSRFRGAANGHYHYGAGTNYINNVAIKCYGTGTTGDGLPYIDLFLSGTSNNTSNANFNILIPGYIRSPGYGALKWSANVQVSNGSITNSIRVVMGWDVYTGFFNYQGSDTIDLYASPSVGTANALTTTMNQATFTGLIRSSGNTPAFILPYVYMQLQPNTTINCTIRIAAPKIEIFTNSISYTPKNLVDANLENWSQLTSSFQTFNVVGNQVNAPDNSLSAFNLQENAGANQYYIQYEIDAPSATKTYTAICYVKDKHPELFTSNFYFGFETLDSNSRVAELFHLWDWWAYHDSETTYTPYITGSKITNTHVAFFTDQHATGISYPGITSPPHNGNGWFVVAVSGTVSNNSSGLRIFMGDNTGGNNQGFFVSNVMFFEGSLDIFRDSPSLITNSTLMTPSDWDVVETLGIPWTKDGSINAYANVVSAPDGSNTGQKITETSSGSQNHGFYQFINFDPVTQQSNTFTFSVYAKPAERTRLTLRLTDFTGGNLVTSTFNLSNGNVDLVATTQGTFSNAAATCTTDTLATGNTGNGWYRCALKATTSVWNAAYGAIYIDGSSSGAAANITYAGTGNVGLYIWGSQNEPGGSAVDYREDGYFTYPRKRVLTMGMYDGTSGVESEISIANSTFLSSFPWGASVWTNVSSSVLTTNNGWTRYSLTATTNNAVGLHPYIRVSNNTINSAYGTYTGDGYSGIYTWQPRFNAGGISGIPSGGLLGVSSITGTLVAEVTANITNEELRVGFLALDGSEPKIYNDNGTFSVINSVSFPNTVTANNLNSNNLFALNAFVSNLAVNSIYVGTFTGNSFTGQQMNLNSLLVTNLTTNSITSNVVTTTNLTTNSITSNVVTTTNVITSDIQTTTFTSTNVTATKISTTNVVCEDGRTNTFTSNTVTISTNTLTLGVSSVAANGYSVLPNGLIYQWGNINVSSVAVKITFPIAFTVNCFSFTACSNDGSTVISVLTVNTTAANVISNFGSAVTSRVRWMAIGQ